MSQKEIKYYDTIKKLSEGYIKAKDAAQMLNLSIRHVKRLKKKIKDGMSAFVHKSRGKASKRKLKGKERQNIVDLLKEKYKDFGPTFASEKLAEINNINRDPKTIRKIMMEENLWKSRKKKETEHRCWRQRKASHGEMEQYDGSYHEWFEDRAPKCCLLAAIDDAQGIITKAKFDEHEGVIPTFNFWKKYVEEKGKPFSIYVDKFSTYSINHKLAKENGDTLTQFERAMQELGIDVIKAGSPQAKGRVERLFETLQDRLVKELRLNNISSIKDANEFLKNKFIPEFNIKFGVESRLNIDMHKDLTCEEKDKLDSIFSRKYKRKVGNDFTMAYNKKWYQLENNQPVTVCKKDTVIVEERIAGGIFFQLKNQYLFYKELPKRPEKLSKITPWILVKKPNIPSPNHPWRKYNFVKK